MHDHQPSTNGVITSYQDAPTRTITAGGASILMFEPTGTSTVGDRHDAVPAHVDATTGHPLH